MIYTVKSIRWGAGTVVTNPNEVEIPDGWTPFAVTATADNKGGLIWIRKAE